MKRLFAGAARRRDCRSSLFATGTDAADGCPAALRGQRPARAQRPYYWLRDDTRKDPDDARLSEGRERLRRRDAGADQAAAGRRCSTRSSAASSRTTRRVPCRERGYWYYTRFATGQEYPDPSRRKAGSLKAKEQVMLDAAGDGARATAYFAVGDYEVSHEQPPPGLGRGRGRPPPVRAQRSRTSRPARRSPTTSTTSRRDLVWADDNQTLFYIEKDPETLLTKRVKAHVLGTPASADELVYEEKDDSFYMGVGRTSDDKYICIAWSRATVSSELRCTSAAKPRQVRRARAARARVPTTRPTTSATAGSSAPTADAQELQAHASQRRRRGERPRRSGTTWCRTTRDVFIEDFEPFDSFIADRGARRRPQAHAAARASEARAATSSPTSRLRDGHRRQSPRPTPTRLRYGYTSLTTPQVTYELDVATGERSLLKRTPGPRLRPGAICRPSACGRRRATATRVPVSLVYRKGFKRDGTAALLQYAYGSYGAVDRSRLRRRRRSRCSTAAWSTRSRTSAAGRRWAAPGTTTASCCTRRTRFTDFIDVTDYLVAPGLCGEGPRRRARRQRRRPADGRGREHGAAGLSR